MIPIVSGTWQLGLLQQILQNDWLDPKPEAAYWRIPTNVKREPVQEQRPEEKKSAEKRGIKERLAEKKMEIEQQSPKPRKKKTID